jgi:hypothetical protein
MITERTGQDLPQWMAAARQAGLPGTSWESPCTDSPYGRPSIACERSACHVAGGRGGVGVNLSPGEVAVVHLEQPQVLDGDGRAVGLAAGGDGDGSDEVVLRGDDAGTFKTKSSRSMDTSRRRSLSLKNSVIAAVSSAVL